MRRFLVVAIVLVQGACALDFGTPPDPLDAPGTVDADSVPSDSVPSDSVVQDVTEDVDTTISADPCDPYREWSQKGDAYDFTNLILGSYSIEGTEAPDWGEVQDVGGQSALVIQQEKVDILVHDVHSGPADNFKIRFYVPQGSVATAWPWYGRDEGAGGAASGVLVGLTAGEGPQRLLLGVVPVGQDPKVTTRPVDMVGRWIEVELIILADYNQVIAFFRPLDDEGDPTTSSEETEVLELNSADLYSVFTDGHGRFAAGAPPSTLWAGSGMGVAWQSAIQSTVSAFRPLDPEVCSICDWHKVWTDNPDFSDEQCPCVEASTPEGGFSSDPGTTYCPPWDHAFERCEWNPQTDETEVYVCAPTNEECFEWQPKPDWSGCEPHAIEDDPGECVSRGCITWWNGETGPGSAELAHCAFVPNQGPDTCGCLQEQADDALVEAFVCEDDLEGYRAAEIDGEAYCGPCWAASEDCTFAHLAPCGSASPCVSTWCDPVKGCQSAIDHEADGEPCDDGDEATPYSYCEAGECQGAEVPVCGDAACTMTTEDCAGGFWTGLVGDDEDGSLTDAWLSDDGRAYIAFKSDLHVLEVSSPNAEAVKNLLDGPASQGGGDIQAVTGNDLGELFVTTAGGLWVSMSAMATLQADWVQVYEGSYEAVWAGSGLHGGPVVGVGQGGLIAGRLPGEAWLGWATENVNLGLGGGDLTLTGVHGVTGEHVKTIAFHDDKAYLISQTSLDIAYQDDVTAYLLEAMGFSPGDPYHFSDVWGAPDHSFYVITSAGHLVRYQPEGTENFQFGLWQQIGESELAPGGYLAISGRQIDGETILVIAGHEGQIQTYNVDTGLAKTLWAEEPGAGAWRDVHMASDGSFVAVGDPGPILSDEGIGNVAIWLETGGCAVACEEELEQPVDDGCMIHNDPTPDGCEAVYAPAGALCDDGDDSTVGDVCVVNPDSSGETLCHGSSGACDLYPAQFAEASCITAFVQDGPHCVPVYAEQGAPCDDGDPGTTSDTCVLLGAWVDSPELLPATVCQGEMIQCPSDPPALEPCFDTWEPVDGETYINEASGAEVENCQVVHLPSGSACDDGDETNTDDTCEAGGACQGKTLAQVADLMAENCLEDGPTRLYCTTMGRSWNGARLLCESQAMDLVVLDNDSENHLVNATFQANSIDTQFWIGLTDQAVEGQYVWSDGYVWSEGDSTLFEAFAPGEPNDFSGDENCVESGPTWSAAQSNGESPKDFPRGWNDLNCASVKGFVCETLPVCGDGQVSSHTGEACDDGNLDDLDACTNDCQLGTGGSQAFCDDLAANSSCINYAAYDAGAGGSVPSDFCVVIHEPLGTVCDAVNTTNGCLGVDICDGAGDCVDVEPLDCAAEAGPCMNGGCLDVDGLADDGCSFTPKAVGESCDDGNPGTSGETCDASGSCGGGEVVEGVSVCTDSSVLFPGGTGFAARDDVSIDLGDQWTLEAWARPLSFGGWRKIVEYGTGEELALRIQIDDAGKPSCLFWPEWDNQANNVQKVASDTPLAMNAWSHLAMVYTNGTMSCYVNGSLIGTVEEATPGSKAFGSPISIGGDYSNPGEYVFHGTIAHVHLTAAALYQGEEVPTPTTAGWNWDTIAYWPMGALMEPLESDTLEDYGPNDLHLNLLENVEIVSEAPNLTCEGAPVDGDSCDNPIMLELVDNELMKVEGSTADANPSYPDACSGEGPDLVYGVQVPAAGTLLYKVPEGPLYHNVSKGEGTGCADPTEEQGLGCGSIIDESGGEFTIDVEGPELYWFKVAHADQESAGPFVFELLFQEAIAGDGCTAATFDGESSFVRTENKVGVIRGDATELTYEAWVRGGNQISEKAHILSTSCNYASVQVEGAKLKAYVWPNKCFGSTTLNPGDWHHVALAFSTVGGGGTLYLDGQVECEISDSFDLNSADHPVDDEFFYVGASTDSCGGNLPQSATKHWKGEITGVKLSWGLYSDTGNALPAPSTALFYDFEDEGGVVIQDLSPNNHHAAFEGLSWFDDPDHCVLEVTCGNGVTDYGEACDDGDTDDNDGCTTSCQSAGAGGPENPGLSCKQIVDDNGAVESGAYWIDPDGAGAGAAFEAYCDMETDGGGWTLAMYMPNAVGLAPPLYTSGAVETGNCLSKGGPCKFSDEVINQILSYGDQTENRIWLQGVGLQHESYYWDYTSPFQYDRSAGWAPAPSDETCWWEAAIDLTEADTSTSCHHPDHRGLGFYPGGSGCELMNSGVDEVYFYNSSGDRYGYSDATLDGSVQVYVWVR